MAIRLSIQTAALGLKVRACMHVCVCVRTIMEESNPRFISCVCVCVSVPALCVPLLRACAGWDVKYDAHSWDKQPLKPLPLPIKP